MAGSTIHNGGPGRNKGGRNYKTLLRMERAIRLEAKGVSDDVIAQHIGLKVTSFRVMKAKPEYQLMRTRIITGVLSKLDEDLGEDVVYLRHRIKQHIPAALEVLVKNLENPDAKVAQAAAESLIDRDGRLAKVSRVGLPDEDQGGFGHTAKFDTSIADALATSLNTLSSGANNAANKVSTTNTSSTEADSKDTGTGEGTTGGSTEGSGI